MSESAPAGESVKASLGGEHTRAAGMGARKLDDGLDTFAARAREEDSSQPAARMLAQPCRQNASEVGDVALQHRRTVAVEFFFNGGL
jgi:hypothetical protein